MGGGVSTDFKSSNGIEISWLVQVLLNFYWFQGSPWWWQMGGWGWGGYGGGGCPIYKCTFMHVHTCTCMLNMINMDASMSAAICNFYTCVCACACTCTFVGTSPCPQMPPTHLPPPQSLREPKTPKFNRLWTNWYNSILFEDLGPLNPPVHI